MRAAIKQKTRGLVAINPDDDPEKFLAHHKISTFYAGWVQGAEYILNDVNACLQEEKDLEIAIKTIEKELKGRKNGA